MKTETLKYLIEVEFERCETISHFKSEVFRLIDLYASEKEMAISTPDSYKDTNSEMVPYHESCGCNPKNGGSGICGCIMGNKLVSKRGSSNITWTSSTTLANFND